MRKPTGHPAADASPPTPVGERERRPLPRRPAVAVTAVVAAAAAILALCNASTVRDQLRESFTRLPDTYRELYFTTPPTVEGGTVRVPVTLRDHGATVTRYHIAAWLRGGSGPVASSVTVAVTPRPDADVVLRLHPLHGPATVYVRLLGHPQTLHFRLVGPPSSDTEGTS